MWKLGAFVFLSTAILCAEIGDRVERLEDAMRELRVETPMGTYGADMGYGQPYLNNVENDWYLTGELLYWNAKIGGTEYAFTSGQPTTLPNPPIKGRVKGHSFGWSIGGRVGIGRRLTHDDWDLCINFTGYQNHNSAGSEKRPPSFLVAQVGFFGGAFVRAKSSFDLTYLNLDLELGKKYFISRDLSFRPFIALKGTRIFEEHKVKLEFSSIELNGRIIGEYYRVYNRCDSDGLGPRIGIQGDWFLGCGFRIKSEISGALLYTSFDVVDKEKNSPNASPINANIRLKGGINRFIPFAQIFTGLNWGEYLQNDRCYLTLSLGYEVLYFWRENQCIQPDNWNFTGPTTSTRLSYKRFAEDLSFYGITFKARFDF